MSLAPAAAATRAYGRRRKGNKGMANSVDVLANAQIRGMSFLWGKQISNAGGSARHADAYCKAARTGSPHPCTTG
jgi:hypothetical protein